MRIKPYMFPKYIILKTPVVMLCDITEDNVQGWKKGTPKEVIKEFEDFIEYQKNLLESKTEVIKI